MVWDIWRMAVVVLLCALMGWDGREATGGTLAPMPAPRGLAAEVEQLRQQPVTLAVAAPHGTLPGASSVDASGQARYTVLLEVAPGVRGMIPRLAIDYQSNRGNGVVGVGFALSGLSSIARCPHTIAQDGAYRPVQFTVSDALCLDGERLLLASGSQGLDGAEYRPRRSPFRKVVLHGDLGSSKETYFEVFTNDGRILRYGTPSQNYTVHPYSWPLLEERDRFDNRIRYDWYPALPPDIPILNRISYGGTGSPHSWRSVHFNYETREDQPSGYFYGHLYRHALRLSHIEVFGPEFSLLHTYRFKYTADPLSGRSHLESLQQCDPHDSCLPPTIFTWQPRSADLEKHFDPFPGGPADLEEAEAQTLLANARRTLVGDFNGDLVQEVLLWPHPDQATNGVVRWYIWQPCKGGPPLLFNT